MANIDILFPFVLSFEGGFANNPSDHGGATNKGVTLTTFKRWRKQQGKPEPTVADLKSITDSEVRQIMKAYYWDTWKADEIKSQSIANLLVDWVWGSGYYGIKYPQQLLGVKDDGIVGPQTLQALNAQDPEKFFAKLKQRREKHFRNIVANDPSQQKFLAGWLRRLDCIGFGYLKHNGGKTVSFAETQSPAAAGSSPAVSSKKKHLAIIAAVVSLVAIAVAAAVIIKKRKHLNN